MLFSGGYLFCTAAKTVWLMWSHSVTWVQVQKESFPLMLGSVWPSSRGSVGRDGSSGPKSGSGAAPSVPCAPHTPSPSAVQRHEGCPGQRTDSVFRARRGPSENEGRTAISQRGRWETCYKDCQQPWNVSFSKTVGLFSKKNRTNLALRRYSFYSAAKSLCRKRCYLQLIFVFCLLYELCSTPALQYKDHSPANPTARQQMMMSAIVKSPEHQQGPTNLAPSSSGRRKDTPVPEGESKHDVQMNSCNRYIQ